MVSGGFASLVVLSKKCGVGGLRSRSWLGGRFEAGGFDPSFFSLSLQVFLEVFMSRLIKSSTSIVEDFGVITSIRFF